MNFDNLKIAYFLGIGGIGMSAIARYFLSEGIIVYGYDRTNTKITKQLEEEGAIISYEDNIDLLPENIELVVYTPAIPANNALFSEIWSRAIPIMKRSQVLGLIGQQKKVIAVAGTHGKTSTSSLLTHFLKVGGVEVTAFLGGISNNIEGNYIKGDSQWMTVEADEYDRSFLTLYPSIAIITSIDPDHLDIYNTEENFYDGFRQFVRQIEKGGHLIIHESAFAKLMNPSLEKHFIEFSISVIRYGIGCNDSNISNIVPYKSGMLFDLVTSSFSLSSIYLNYRGNHNVENAVGAILASIIVGVDPKNIQPAAETFKGIWRRFDVLFDDGKRIYIDDYAHHPTELKAVIGSIKKVFPGKSLTGIFQPHLFTRTRDFLEGFADSLDMLDEAILLDIYPARETPIEGINSDAILAKMKSSNKALISKNSVVEYIKTKDVELLATLGAGDIDGLREDIVSYLNASR